MCLSNQKTLLAQRWHQMALRRYVEKLRLGRYADELGRYVDKLGRYVDKLRRYGDSGDMQTSLGDTVEVKHLAPHKHRVSVSGIPRLHHGPRRAEATCM